MDEIITLLSILSKKIELSNSINLNDINIHSENFFRDFLNLLYGYNLKNINITDHNASAIDLADCSKKIAFQVTSTPDLCKTKTTVTAFIKKRLYHNYDRLIMLILTNKINHKYSFIGEPGKYQLDIKKDIWDIKKITRDINGFSLDRIKEVRSFLSKEIRVNLSREKILEKEIQTFIALINYLSDENQPSAGNGFIEEPDPYGKINNRFSEHSVFLKNEYQELYMEYGKVLDEVMRMSNIGSTRIRRLGLHLKLCSDNILSEHEGNAKDALNVLVKKYTKYFTNDNLEYDENAIKFFMVDQIIRCNVFPNKKE